MLLLIVMAFQAATPFALIDRNDPITGDRQLLYATSYDGNTLAIGCGEVGKQSIFIRLIPDRYYGPDPDGLIWEPNAVYRFRNDKKPDKDKWTFNSNYIQLGDLWGTNKAKAQFLDRLMKNDQVHIRYEARQGTVKTLTFNYSLSTEQLANVIRTCNPQRVQKYLKEFKTPGFEK
ncbi:hypothetical protein ACR9YC_04410 [Parasphingorhabdus sp. DH2-15]|uniref:hypothetical protein n=1 Tax=Parasphingorhabdus sp. DH2-15 TaxID=3444112 RepID=UPI003F684E6A